MAFNQRHFDRSFNQARDIFNKYVYVTTDTIADVLAASYFDKSRFIDDKGWIGGIIDATCSDGFITIQLDSSGGALVQYNSNDVSPRSIVPINSPSDWPTNGSEITPVANTLYEVAAGLPAEARRFILPAGPVTIQGVGFATTPYELTNAGDIFTGTNTALTIRDVALSASVGKLFEFDGIGGVVVIRDSVITECDRIGNFTDSSFSYSDSTFVDVKSSGVSFAGNPIAVIIRGSRIIASAPIDCVDLGSAVFSSRAIFSNFETIGPVGSQGIVGLTSSGNILPGRVGVIDSCNLNGDSMNPTDGIVPSDIRWDFSSSSGFLDSSNNFDAHVTPGTFTVAVGAGQQGVWRELGIPSTETWVGEHLSRTSMSTSGVITNISERPICMHVSGAVPVRKNGGGKDEIEAALAVDWDSGSPTVGVLQGSGTTTENPTYTSCVLNKIVVLNPGQNLRVITKNNGSTADIDVKSPNYNG